ncbi:ADP-ribosylation factor GTPase-activating protein AGD12 [Dichanthelium oligosanthes]|uniref:ADP-ribosylation factor GTPase-activating protein AGD12 n=1 Tax=Dichanthelium oligosanthes TaxID=888268 RepID=A0A1E5WJK9_9POAL|nr:ADP-ribosylation factor GTPase-activating protein AGD12 [Dichanthelium oligosanthes]
MSTTNRYQHIKSTKPVVGKTRKLKDLMMKSDNRICADCGAPDPKWASANIGVFLCLKCGDVHRALGPDISKVLSITLDDWDDSDIDSMVEVGGNSYANSIYEAFLPKDHPKPKADSTMEYRTKFIRAKYETQDFLKPSLRISSKSSFKSTSSTKSVYSSFSSTSRKDTEVYDHDTFSADDIMGEAEIDLQPMITAAMAFGDTSRLGDMQIGRWFMTKDNALLKDSTVNVVGGRVKQEVHLKLQNVESGELELEVEWVPIL